MESFPEIEIQEFKVFGEVSSAGNDTLNISYGTDENYLDGVGVSITSVILNNTISVAFHIICDKYPEIFLNKIEQLSNQYNVKISLYLIDVTRLKDLPQTKVWSRAMYFRLFAFDYFSKRIDKLLYLDADVICKGSLDPLLNVEMQDNIAAVVKDVESIQYKVNDRLPGLNLKDHYFNSGVVLVNLPQWAANSLTAKALSLLSGNDVNSMYYKYPDQDVLNILLINRVVFLPREYNAIYTIKSELKDKKHSAYAEIITSDTRLIHYTGATKPWHAWARYPSVIYFKNALEKSPWKNDPPRDAKTMVEYKKRYKHLLIQKHYVKGITAGLAYLYRKILSK